MILTGPQRHKKENNKENTEISEKRKINSAYRTDAHDYRKHTNDD